MSSPGDRPDTSGRVLVAAPAFQLRGLRGRLLLHRRPFGGGLLRRRTLRRRLLRRRTLRRRLLGGRLLRGDVGGQRVAPACSGVRSPITRSLTARPSSRRYGARRRSARRNGSSRSAALSGGVGSRPRPGENGVLAQHRAMVGDVDGPERRLDRQVVASTWGEARGPDRLPCGRSVARYISASTAVA